MLVVGENGVGKTNLLEALSLLSPGTGLRRVPFTDLSRSGANAGFSIGETCPEDTSTMSQPWSISIRANSTASSSENPPGTQSGRS